MDQNPQIADLKPLNECRVLEELVVGRLDPAALLVLKDHPELKWIRVGDVRRAAADFFADLEKTPAAEKRSASKGDGRSAPTRS
jgi:hypothetical protein